jgi:hypothetical protein
VSRSDRRILIRHGGEDPVVIIERRRTVRTNLCNMRHTKMAREHERTTWTRRVSVYNSKERHHNWSLSCLSLARRARDVRQYRHDAERISSTRVSLRAHCDDPAVIWGRRVFISFCTDEPADAALE